MSWQLANGRRAGHRVGGVNSCRSLEPMAGPKKRLGLPARSGHSKKELFENDDGRAQVQTHYGTNLSDYSVQLEGPSPVGHLTAFDLFCPQGDLVSMFAVAAHVVAHGAPVDLLGTRLIQINQTTVDHLAI